MFGTKIMGIGTSMDAYFQKWALFLYLLTGRFDPYFFTISIQKSNRNILDALQKIVVFKY